MAKVEITQVRIEINGKTLELSLDEARELMHILAQTLTPEDKPERVIKRIIERPYRVWEPWPYPRWSLTYSNDAVDARGQWVTISSTSSTNTTLDKQ